LLVAGTPASAANPEWAKLAAEFSAKFKAKPGVSLEQKRKAVNALAKSNDGRAADLLISVVDDQAKYSGKLRKEWEEGEAAWKEKTERLEKIVEAKRKQAKERGEDSVSVTPEEADWLGANDREGKMVEAKKQLAQKYRVLLEEEKLVEGIERGIARVLNTLEGEEFDKAAAKVALAAAAGKDQRKLSYVRGLGYAKGEKILGYLEAMTKDTNLDLVQIALEAIGRQNSERGADILIAKLDDARWQVRASAITGLSFYRNGAVVGKVMDALIARAKKEDGVLQRNFFVGLARIVQESIPGTVEAWESWWLANRDEFIKKVTEREGNGLPIEEDPQDILVETNQGSSSFYGITTSSKHIIFVVDVSGSMRADAEHPEIENPPPDAKTRIIIAREELKKALTGLTSKEGDERGEANFNIVIFSTGVEVYKAGKMIDASKNNKDDAMKWIDEKVVADGMTNIFDALEQAFNIISATSDAKNLKRGADTIFLMTDGFANRGKFIDDDLIVAEVKKLNEVRKLTIHVIGVGEQHNPKLLRELAAANGGQYIGR
jgi:hypothetical protein